MQNSLLKLQHLVARIVWIILYPTSDLSVPYSQYGAVLLGSPIGTDEYCINFFKDVLNKLRVEANHITSLQRSFCWNIVFLKRFSIFFAQCHLISQCLISPSPLMIYQNTEARSFNWHAVLASSARHFWRRPWNRSSHPFTAHVSFSGSFIESFSSIEEKIRSIRTSINDSSSSSQYNSYDANSILELREVRPNISSLHH